MHRDREDFFRRVVRHLFDVHAAGAGGDHRNAAALAIERQAQVQLALDFRAGFDVHLLDRESGGAGLLGDEPLAEHRGGRRADRLELAHQLDAAGFAAAAGVHLRLDDPGRAAQRTRGGFGFVRVGGHQTFRNRDAVVR